MLKSIKLVNTTSVESLSQIWAERYVPDLSTLSLQNSQCSVSELVEAASPQGREQTIAKLSRTIEINCKCAGIQTSVMFSYIPNVVNLTESQGIARAAGLVYEKVLEVYEVQSPPLTLQVAKSQAETIELFSNLQASSAKLGLTVSEVKQLAIVLEPVLLEFQRQYLSSPDRRAVGFLSTQFHLSSKLVLNRLTLAEQMLVSPYFKFVEEQVCIPWQRVCGAAANYELDSPRLALVQQLLPKSQDIAEAVYQRAVKLYPNHRSRRGRLSNGDIKLSTVRDLQMFQGYLSLCVLEESMASVQDELLPLCTMVFPAVEVSWELVEQMTRLLMDEVLARVSNEYKSLLVPYTTAMQQLFSKSDTNCVSEAALKKLGVRG
ncbi:MAG: hypothetical protein F6K28_21490 [Microcoleus sp. SIO2G3]|nr:hypothetical protein [Microcoleus sp. SIO2G3]